MMRSENCRPHVNLCDHQARVYDTSHLQPPEPPTSQLPILWSGSKFGVLVGIMSPTDYWDLDLEDRILDEVARKARDQRGGREREGVRARECGGSTRTEGSPPLVMIGQGRW